MVGMRVLMSALPSLGHVNPCLAVATALRSAGHEVRLATAPGFASQVRAAGFPQVNLGFDLPRPGDVLTPRLAQRLYGLLIDSFGFWVEDLREQVEEWAPDVLVHDWSEVAGVAVGAKLGIPSAVLGNALRPPMSHVAESRCWLGVDFDEIGGPDHAFGDLLLNLYPPSFAWPDDDRLPYEHYLRPPSYDGATTMNPPDWLDALDGAPLVYLTMGTYYARLPRVMERLVEAAGGVSAQVVVTVGTGRDPAELGPLPANVRVERYVPQSLLIPHCAAVICQGGLNAMVAALSHGVPVGCLPVTWGEPLGFNAAEHCAQLGAGLIYPIGDEPQFGELDPSQITAMIEKLLTDSGYVGAAKRVAVEIETLPTIDEAVPLIEALIK
jgi:UDP:flavonoid glycosyltransferase YjiC (YdhE family)